MCFKTDDNTTEFIEGDEYLMTVPKFFYELVDDITLIFSGSTVYGKSLNYTVSIRSNYKTVDYTMLF